MILGCYPIRRRGEGPDDACWAVPAPSIRQSCVTVEVTFMSASKLPGLFITGTDTAVGKTYTAARIAAAIAATGCRVGVYKPVASGCLLVDGELVSEDAVSLWKGAGGPGEPATSARSVSRLLWPRIWRHGLRGARSRSNCYAVASTIGSIAATC